jgi:hypothetical protein
MKRTCSLQELCPKIAAFLAACEKLEGDSSTSTLLPSQIRQALLSVGLPVLVVDAVVQQCAQHERERVDYRDLVLLNAATYLSRTTKCYYISVPYY